MIAVETNILVYSHRGEMPESPAARAALSQLAQGEIAWAIPWPCLQEFFGIVTHPRIFRPPSTVDAALLQVDYWIGSPSLVLLSETGDHWTVLRSMLKAGDVRGPRVHDARIAAICAGHGVRELWTADRDFTRFPALRIRNPLIQS